MNKLIDVVYPIGNGSGWKNNELRFSLRALEKNGINVGKIFIVGVLPEFMGSDVIHIPAMDTYLPAVNADGNIIFKVLAACRDPRLSRNFLFINDDHILLEPTDISGIPNFHKGDMNDYPENYWGLNYWRSRLKKTRDILNEKGLSAYHFDCHTPIIFDKVKFTEVMGNFNYQEGIGLTMKSLYGNSVCEDNCTLLKNEKRTVFLKFTEPQLESRLKNTTYLSFNDNGLNDALKIWLFKRFPENSKWEKTEMEDRNIEILKWLNGKRDYNEGVRLVEKYLKVYNLIKLFKENENEYLRKKLEYKLNNALNEEWKKER